MHMEIFENGEFMIQVNILRYQTALALCLKTFRLDVESVQPCVAG